MTVRATILDELVDELSRLTGGLKSRTQSGSAGREYLNGLQRDIYVLEKSIEAADDQVEDSRWLAPFIEVFLTKIELGPRLLPDSARAFEDARQRLIGYRRRNDLLALLREELPALLDDPAALDPRSRALLDSAEVVPLIRSSRWLLSVPGEPPAEWRASGLLLEALGLQRALETAEGIASPHSDAITRLIQRLEAAFSATLGQGERPELGAVPEEGEALVVRGAKRMPMVRAGTVAQVFARGFRTREHRLSRPVVLTSAGLESNLLMAGRQLLADLEDADWIGLKAHLEPLGARLSRALDSADTGREERGAAALDLAEGLLSAIEDEDARAILLGALSDDFEGQQVELLLPVPGTPMAEGCGWESRDIFTAAVEPGIITRLLRPGLKIDGELVRPALVQVSRGEPPPGAIEEILALLPEGEPRAEHLRQRIERARGLAASDTGAQLARELADLALQLRDAELNEAARLAFRQVLDDPPQALAEAVGWEAVREFLDEHFETLLEDGENGELGAHRLVRPYLQGLRTRDLSGARLRSLGESMNPLLSLYDESMAAEARGWLFAELERLSAEGLPSGGHARRLMRTAARSVGRFYQDDEITAALELTQALETAGVQVYPQDEASLARCPVPERAFHRLNARYDTAERFKILGGFEPAATTGDAENEGVTETGAITLSLGPTPALVEWLGGAAVRGSRLAGASARLVEEVTALDLERLRAELRGEAGAERDHCLALSKLLNQAIEDSGWSRGDSDREAFAPLFEILEREHKLMLLPGYFTYRRLNKLADQHGGHSVSVTVERGQTRKIDVDQLGAVYRDELVAPLSMIWSVGAAPPYVDHLRRNLPWFDAVLEGNVPSIKLSPAAVEAIRDFDSPDASGLEGVVRSVSVLVHYLTQEVPEESDRFCKTVREAPELELDFFPLPGKTYSSDRLLAALEKAGNPDKLAVVRDTGREDGEAFQVERIGLYKEGRLVSEEPEARFALKALPSACEDFQKAIKPVVKSSHVIASVKSKLRGAASRLALTPPGPGQTGIELSAFHTLLESRLLDPSYDDSPDNRLHEAGAYLVGRLQAAGLIQVERFLGAKTLKEVLDKYSEEGAEVEDVFAPIGSPELAQVRRPLVLLEGRIIQPAYLMRGVPTKEEEVLEFDKVLIDSLDRLRAWQEGPGALVEGALDSKQAETLPRTIKRIRDVRQKMFDAARRDKAVLPPDTARRDLIRFLIDQVHRAEDALAILDDQTYRGAFGDSVFRDVVFRITSPYLSRVYNIAIDTAVVAGADTTALVGRFKVESSGPKPKRLTPKIFSVVIPCYKQDGVTIRPAVVRTGVY